MAMQRRQFMRNTMAAAAVSGLAGTSMLWGANREKIRFAQIGCGGRGKEHFGMWRNEKFVAAVDTNRKVVNMFNANTFPDLKRYTDFREMYANHMDEIDAVIVSTPDHTHYAAAMPALAAGKAVYCEKPLAWSMEECFALASMAEKKKVATQMGNQGNGQQGWRDCYSIVKGGLIGDVKEVHTWTNRPIWPQGRQRPDWTDPVPDDLDWESWIGPAQMVPYVDNWRVEMNCYSGNAVYTPRAWRGWYDFGCGALGDMACHTMNAMFRIMKPEFDCTIEPIEVIDPTDVTFPAKEVMKWSFARKGDCPGFDNYWYDGKLRPEKPEDMGEHGLPDQGSMFVGTKGTLIVGGDYNSWQTLYKNGQKIEKPEFEPLLPKAEGNIYSNFMRAVKGETAWDDTVSNFMYSGKMAAIFNMATVCQRVGEKISFSSQKMKFDNARANELMSRTPREGWEDAYKYIG